MTITQQDVNAVREAAEAFQWWAATGVGSEEDRAWYNRLAAELWPVVTKMQSAVMGEVSTGANSEEVQRVAVRGEVPDAG